MDHAQYFDSVYEGIPRWDIPDAQPCIQGLVAQHKIAGPVLDLGCGTGENALFLARAGIRVTGVDFSQKAIEKAKSKSCASGAGIDFFTEDALNLDQFSDFLRIERRPAFRTVLDCCLYHVLADEDRARYAVSLGRFAARETTFYLLCFSDLEPKVWGPRRIGKGDIRASFKADWHIHSILPCPIEYRKLCRFKDNDESPHAVPTNVAQGWLAHMTRR